MQNSRSLILMLTCAVALMGCNASTPPSASQQAEQAPASSSDTAAATPAPAATATIPPTPDPAAPAAPAARPPGRFAEELRNAEYTLGTRSTDRTPLKDGVYDEPIAGSSSRNVVRLGPAPTFGDLNGDRVEDAAVTLVSSAGGSGTFTHVSAVLNDDGAARPVGSVLIGDRIIMQSMRIVDGKIHVTWLDRKPGEPMSTTPTTRVSKTFAVQGGKLVEVANAGTDASAGTEQLRGLYTWGAEVETFQPCGSSQKFWVVGDKSLLQSLRDRSAQLAQTRGKPYQPFYIEASAVSEGKATDGFAMDYDAVYRLKAVHTVSETIPADCVPR
jgi:hypothetical protein